MTTPAAFATSQTQIGIAIEATRGTGVTPAYWLPVNSPKYEPKIDQSDDKALRGSMVEIYDMVPGLRYDSHGWSSFPYLDSFPLLIRAELGSTDSLTAAPTSTTLSAAATAGATTVDMASAVSAGDWFTIGSGTTLETHKAASVSSNTVTLNNPLIYAQASGAAVTGLTTHQFSLLNNAASTANQPPSVTITDFDGQEWRQLTGAQLDKLTLKATAKGLVDYDCTWFANAATTLGTSPSASYTSARAVPGWTTAVSIGGTSIGYLTDWEIDLGRKVQPIPAFSGNQTYMAYFTDVIDATAKLTFVEQSGAPQLADYLDGATEALDISVFDIGTGDAMELHCTTAKYRTGSVERSKEWVETTLDVQLLPSSTDANSGGLSPIEITVANGQTSTY